MKNHGQRLHTQLTADALQELNGPCEESASHLVSWTPRHVTELDTADVLALLDDLAALGEAPVVISVFTGKEFSAVSYLGPVQAPPYSASRLQVQPRSRFKVQPANAWRRQVLDAVRYWGVVL
jgi:hypothetical protein